MPVAFFAVLLSAPRYGANGKHRQDRQRCQLELLVSQRRCRQNRQHRVRAQGHPQPIHRKPGAQGRIRTSVARKERQIYSLLPLTTRPPVHASTEHPALSTFLRAKSWGPESPVPAVRTLRSKRFARLPQQNSTTATRPYFRARLAIQEAAAGISSLGELRVSFGLLLLRLGGALIGHNSGAGEGI